MQNIVSRNFSSDPRIWHSIRKSEFVLVDANICGWSSCEYRPVYFLFMPIAVLLCYDLIRVIDIKPLDNFLQYLFPYSCVLN